MDIIREEWWPTPVWYFDIPKSIIDYDLIATECYNFKILDNNGRKISNIGGWQSDNLYVNNSESQKNINNLMKLIESKSELLFKDYNIKKSLKPHLDNFWININSLENHNAPHIHHNSVFSGVYYVKAPEECGGIIFHKSQELSYLHGSYTDCNNRLTYSEIKYTPEQGRVLIFPSWINHSVQPNKSLEDRISIAFNFTGFYLD